MGKYKITYKIIEDIGLLNMHMEICKYKRLCHFLTFDPGISYFDNFFYLLKSHVANGTKFQIQPVGTEGNTCFSNGPGHMTNMATSPKYGKNL